MELELLNFYRFLEGFCTPLTTTFLDNKIQLKLNKQ